MRIEWNDWQFFLAAATSRNMTRAAKSMLVDQSTMSRRLGALEQKLGAKLFVRSRRGLEPTHAATRLVPILARASAALEEAERVLSWRDDPPQGTVRIATLEAVANYMLIPALPRLVQQHPGIRVEILPGATVTDLSTREADIALRLVPPNDSEILAKPVDAGPLAAYLAKSKRMPKRSVKPTELVWIGWDDARASQPEHRWMTAHRVSVVLRASQASSMIQGALAGLGAVLLPQRFGDRIAGLKRVDVERLPTESVTLWLATPRALRHEPVVEPVWEWLLSLFR